MAPAIFNKLRRRQSSSLPLRTQHPQSIVHHASTPPDWPTQPAQATPDVYITSPPEDDGDGLLTSVCIHRAVEHEPKKLRRHEDHPPVVSSDAGDSSVEAPPVFRRSSLHTPDVVLPKKPSELARETAKWAQILNRQPATSKEGMYSSLFPYCLRRRFAYFFFCVRSQQPWLNHLKLRFQREEMQNGRAGTRSYASRALGNMMMVCQRFLLRKPRLRCAIVLQRCSGTLPIARVSISALALLTSE